jgi:hypothetical protein
MNFIDVIFFQAELAPEKLAILAEGHVISYGQLAHGIVSARGRLAMAGLRQGHTVGLVVAHPIDHFILICALRRLKVTSASIGKEIDAYLDNIRFDAVLADRIEPIVSRKQPGARLLLVTTAWFQDEVTFSVAERTGRHDPDPDWVCRVAWVENQVAKTTARALEAQLTAYCLAAPPDWERMISVSGLQSLAGLLHALTALWLGRTVCFADTTIARNVIVAYRHHYLVAATHEIDPLLTQQATDFIALALRGAFVTGQRFPAAMMAKCLETISTDTIVSYTHPALGIIAYGAAGRMKDVEGAAGFVAPWIELEVLAPDRAPLAAGAEGELRFRARGDQADVGWTYPGQRARLMANNLLVIC